MTAKSPLFVVSQPRAGSTLVQNLLARHDEISTLGEGWVMLPLVSLLGTLPDVSAVYDSQLAGCAVKRVWDEIGSTAEDGLRVTATAFYEDVLSKIGGRFFVDKTPRYYYILPDLRRVFPDAVIVVLFRNPLAVLCSIVSTWVGEKFYLFQQYHDDLLVAPEKLVDAVGTHHNTLTLQYESVIQAPETLRPVFEALHVQIEGHLFETRIQTEKVHEFGDTKFYQTAHINPNRANAWMDLLKNPQVWRLARDYLDYLGPTVIEKMGYEYDDLLRVLEQHRPKRLHLAPTLSLRWLLRYQRHTDFRDQLRYAIFRAGRRMWL